MFEPILLVGRYTTTLKGIDNEQINKDVLLRKDMKLDDTPGNTFQEDSFYPETEACNHLLKEVDKVIVLAWNYFDEIVMKNKDQFDKDSFISLN